MEQYPQYLMWLKRNNGIIKNSLISHSWEEEAFAEDARGPLGGFVWPPRSYSCSFCRREFRSAQALGGHMNVHRRERAKLKQTLINGTQQNYPKSNLSKSENPSFFRLSSKAIFSTTLGSNSDETNLFLGFDGNCVDEEVVNCKRQKTVVVSPLVMGEDQVDLELRLAS